MNIIKNIKFSKLLSDFDRLKHNISEWVIALDTKQYDLQKRQKELEQRITQIEKIHGKKIR